MPTKGYNRFENLLPNDKDLIKRSIIWGTVFEKYAKEEETEKIVFSFTNEDENNESSSESIEPLNFETNNENDSNFDVQDTLNKTKKYVEKRKENWHASGLDQIMDSFNLNKIQSKVGNWLGNDSNLFFNNLVSKTSPHPVSFLNEEVEIKNHEIYSDNESVDTAKYILSSRKRSKSKITTMTIKRYRYSNRKATNEYYDNPDEKYVKTICANSGNGNRFSNNILKHSKRNINKDFGRNYRRKKSTDTSRASSSTKEISGIGCTVFPESNKKFNRSAIKPSKPKNQRKICRKSSKWRNVLNAKENNQHSSSSERSTPSPRKNFCRKYSKIQKSNNNLREIDDNTSSQSEINFNENNFINSTALTKPNEYSNRQFNKVDECPKTFQESNKPKRNNNESTAKRLCCTPIVLYEPENSKLSSSMSIEKCVITKKLLTDKIGEDLAEKILNGDKEIAKEFDSSSKIIFYPPESNSGNSSNSDSDFLEKVFKRKGRLVEVVDII